MFLTMRRELLEEMQQLDLEVVLPGAVEQQLLSMQIRSALVEQIKEAEAKDVQFQKLRLEAEAGLRSDIVVHADGSLRFGARLCVPKGRVRQELMVEAHSSSYSVHPGGT